MTNGIHLVSCYATQEFCVKRDPEAQRDTLMITLHCVTQFRAGDQHLVCQSLTSED